MAVFVSVYLGMVDQIVLIFCSIEIYGERGRGCRNEKM